MKVVFSLGLLALVLLLLSTQLTLTVRDVQMTEDLIASEQAYALAESGLLHGKHQVALDPTWRGPLHEVPFGAGTYSVRVVVLSGNTLQLESVGVADQAKVQLSSLWVSGSF